MLSVIIRYCTFLFSFFLLSSLLVAQKKSADELFDKLEYVKAIPKYEKSSKSSDLSEKQQSLIRLGDCYRLLSDFKKSEEYYKQALSLGENVKDEVHFHYGNVLKINANYKDALDQYAIFLKSHPKDKTAENALKSCQEIKYWQSKPQEYQVNPVEQVNTKSSEFAPVVFKDQLIYTGETQNDIVDFSVSNTNGQPYMNVMYINLNKKNSKTKSYSKKVNTNYHDGPVSFSSDGKQMVVTRVNYVVNKKNKDFVNRAKLYFFERENEHWNNSASFPYNSDDYSCAHASFSPDHKWLFFVSDMPGGFGGKDIWVCAKNGTEWGKPVNLGPDINTSADELFPYMRKDSVLFFASNGLPGFGGLDIFSAKNKNGQWILSRNEGMQLNSSADDFGMVFVNDSVGYFSSNREGGKGSDDIYSFKFTNKYVTLSGTVLLTENTNDPAKNIKIYLLDQSSNKVDSTITNHAGYFEFKDLEADKYYMAEVDDNDPQMKNKARFYLANKNNQIVRVTHQEGGGKKFVFKNLPVDPNGLPEIYASEDELSLAGNLLIGENPSKPLANKKIIIKNEYGDVVEETTTNEFGAFAFRNLPLDQNYLLYVEDSDIPADAKITLTTKNGKEVKVVKSDSKGNFKFNLLSTDKETLKELTVDESELIMALHGFLFDQDKKALANAKVTILDNEKVIENILTDVNGKFEFKNLHADKNYLFMVDDSDNQFSHVTKIYVADSKGRVYKEIKRSQEGKFQFNLLQMDKAALADYSVDDPWLQVLEMKNKQKQEELTIIENLYYAYGDWRLDATAKRVLDKVINILVSNSDLKIELSSHTDSRSSDQFNMQLSQKRAKAAVDYMIAKGISKNRLKAIGYGETKLLNRCANNVDCSEEEHAKNRRTEFKIIESSK